DRFAALDLVDVFHALDHLAPDRVLVVEKAGVVEANEKLAVAGVRIGCTGHRDGAAHVRLLVELRLELLTRAAGAGAVRAAGLRHEPVDNAMKDDPVVKAVLHQFLDARDMSLCKVRAHLDHYFAFAGLQRQRIFWLRHITPSHNTNTTNVSARWLLS